MKTLLLLALAQPMLADLNHDDGGLNTGFTLFDLTPHHGPDAGVFPVRWQYRCEMFRQIDKQVCDKVADAGQAYSMNCDPDGGLFESRPCYLGSSTICAQYWCGYSYTYCAKAHAAPQPDLRQCTTFAQHFEHGRWEDGP